MPIQPEAFLPHGQVKRLRHPVEAFERAVSFSKLAEALEHGCLRLTI